MARRVPGPCGVDACRLSFRGEGRGSGRFYSLTAVVEYGRSWHDLHVSEGEEPECWCCHAPSVCCVWVGVACRNRCYGGLKLPARKPFGFGNQLRDVSRGARAGPGRSNGRPCNSCPCNNVTVGCATKFCNGRPHLRFHSTSHSTQKEQDQRKVAAQQARGGPCEHSAPHALDPCSPGLWTCFREELPDTNLRFQPLTCGASYPRRQPNPRCKP